MLSFLKLGVLIAAIGIMLGLTVLSNSNGIGGHTEAGRFAFMLATLLPGIFALLINAMRRRGRDTHRVAGGQKRQ